MFKMNKPKSVVPLKIELTDIITPKSCSYFIAQLIKYIAYSKHQIPYPYERLKMYVLKRRDRLRKLQLSNSDQDPETAVRAVLLMEKYYKKVEEAFEIMDSTFKCIEEELMHSSENPVEEIVLLFGATPISPKDVYRIKIPSLCYGHSEAQHLMKRQLANLFREIIVSDEVNANMQREIGLTNMFVMLKVKKGGCANSNWLLPKDHYMLSKRTQQVCFSFRTLSSKACSCSTEVNQFDMLSHDMAALNLNDESMLSSENDDCNRFTFESDDQFVWFQTPRSLKGFKDCKTQGKSVTDLWYKHSFIL